MTGRKILVGLAACIAISGCSIRLSKPDSPDYAEVTTAIRANGKPAVLIKKVETYGIQEVDLNPDNLPKVTTVYLRSGRYLAEVGCQFERTFDVDKQSRTDISYSASRFVFSVEANKKYVLDCDSSGQQFTLKEVAP